MNMRRGGFGGRVVALLVGLLLGPSACTYLVFDYQPSLALEKAEGIHPGVTHRSEVLARLGPPEEFRHPSRMEGSRRLLPQEFDVLEARNVFGRDAFTYCQETRVERRLSIVPFVNIVAWSWSESSERRLRIEFDEAGFVTSVAVVAGDLE